LKGARSSARGGAGSSPRPLQARFLLGSRWTARRPLDGSGGERHFEVLEVRRGAEPCAVLRAVLTDQRYAVPVRALRDAAAWSTGWVSLPATPGQE
jgi:tryptophan-rich hypothetical protein